MARDATRPTTGRFDLERKRKESDIALVVVEALAKSADGAIQLDQWEARESLELRLKLDARASAQGRELLFGRLENSGVMLLFVGTDEEVLERVGRVIAAYPEVVR